MTTDLRMWTEIVFNLAYLAVIWALVAAMTARRHRLAPEARPSALPLLWAFALLALGDTGHVGFRVWAFALGDLEARLAVTGQPLALVGLGALATALTVTGFYVLILIAWQRRFAKPLGWVGVLLLTAAVVRLVLMALPQNEWERSVPPQPWSLIRNLPLMLQGLGVAALLLRDATAQRDRGYQWLGIWILVSFAFYLPVILFVQSVPALGMLMIPKTLAYLACAWLVWRRYFDPSAPAVLAVAVRVQAGVDPVGEPSSMPPQDLQTETQIAQISQISQIGFQSVKSAKSAQSVFLRPSGRLRPEVGLGWVPEPGSPTGSGVVRRP